MSQAKSIHPKKSKEDGVKQSRHKIMARIPEKVYRKMKILMNLAKSTIHKLSKLDKKSFWCQYYFQKAMIKVNFNWAISISHTEYCNYILLPIPGSYGTKSM